MFQNCQGLQAPSPLNYLTPWHLPTFTYKDKLPSTIVGSHVRTELSRLCHSGGRAYWEVVCSLYHSSASSTDFPSPLNNGNHSVGRVASTSYFVVNNLSSSNILTLSENVIDFPAGCGQFVNKGNYSVGRKRTALICYSIDNHMCIYFELEGVWQYFFFI